MMGSAPPRLLHLEHATWSAPLDEVDLLYVAAVSDFDFDDYVRGHHNGACWAVCEEGRDDWSHDWRCKDAYCLLLAFHIWRWSEDWPDGEEQRAFPPEVLAWGKHATELYAEHEVQR